MVNAASTSNPSCIVDIDEAFPYRSHVIGPSIVTVKLSGKNKYNLWRLQMECLLKSQHMVRFIEGRVPSSARKGKEKLDDVEAWNAGDSLVKGWILGSLSEEAARKVVDQLTYKHTNTYFSAKDLWQELQRSYGLSVREQTTAESKLTTGQPESARDTSSTPEDAKSKEEKTKNEKIDEILHKDYLKRLLVNSIIKGNTGYVINKVEEKGLKPWDKLTNNGNTTLHVAVGSSTKNQELLKTLLEMTPKEKTLVDMINSDGSTLLHVAAIGGNTEAVNMLVERNPNFLLATDKEGHIPLALSVSNMHTKTSKCLFEHMKQHGCSSLFAGQSGEELVVLAISCQDFSLARKIIKDYPDAILSDSDAVLMALSQNFPPELNFWEMRGSKKEFLRRLHSFNPTFLRLDNCFSWPCGSELLMIFTIIFIGFYALAFVFYQFFVVLVRLFLEDTFQIHEDATNLLSDLCEEILIRDNSDTYHQYCTDSIFEATRRNSSTFVRRIMRWFPDVIGSANEEGHNFIQLTVINRSEKIYSLLYEMSEHKNIYKTIKDSYGNNLLHLAARLAPTNKLNLISGAALQIQRELQWFKEVEGFVCPLNRIQKNLDDHTPQMVFTREHKDLVIEAQNWTKKTAESYTITAALITTIVFAAAITVPGGNKQESGIPVFTNNIAFIIFAVSDAISLFTAVTSLLMCLSILTSRFAEQDFLIKLPTKLIIGVTMLFLSTTSMVIAFGATLFLVFGQKNLLMLIPIGALTCLPVTSFVTLQFPLIVELIHATYCGGFFVREEYDYFY